jgi:hypothetical protein
LFTVGSRGRGTSWNNRRGIRTRTKKEESRQARSKRRKGEAYSLMPCDVFPISDQLLLQGTRNIDLDFFLFLVALLVLRKKGNTRQSQANRKEAEGKSKRTSSTSTVSSESSFFDFFLEDLPSSSEREDQVIRTTINLHSTSDGEDRTFRFLSFLHLFSQFLFILGVFFILFQKTLGSNPFVPSERKRKE